MATFKDTAGREWAIKIDAPSIMRIRQEYDPKFMLGDDGNDNTFLRVESDPVLLCGAVYVLCDRQRESRNVTQESFYLEVLGDGDSIAAAGEALRKAMLDFTPPRMRALLEASAAKRDRIQQIWSDQIMAKMSNPELEEGLKERLDQELERLLQPWSTGRESATGSPAGSGSRPQD